MQSVSASFYVWTASRQSADIDIDFAVFNLYRIGAQRLADRGPFRFSGAIIELAVVHRAFDDVVHHQAVGQMPLFMGAISISAEIFIVRTAIDSKAPIAMIEADQILLVDVLSGTCVYIGET